jgi:hypothetical protein
VLDFLREKSRIWQHPIDGAEVFIGFIVIRALDREWISMDF